jgi:integrase
MRYTIGPCSDLTIEQARNRAEELNSDIALGKNPATKKRLLREEPTLRQLFNVFLENHSKKNKKTWADDEGMFNCHLAHWKLRKISSIRKADVTGLHVRIGRTSPYSANRVCELLSSMYNRAREWGWEGENPAAGIKAFKEKKRERFMSGEELKAFFKSLSEELNATIRDYLLVSLLTGARRANVQAMRWDELDLKRGTWMIPGEKAKAGESINLPLSPAVVKILESRKISAGVKPWVFRGRGKSGHLIEPKSGWKRILKRAELSDLRLHDLRRTLGSWQAATGASLPIIGKSLGHTSLQATQIYARLDLDPVRAAVNKATTAMLEAGDAGGLL